MGNKPKRQPDAARRAKLTIQRRTMCLMLLFGVVTFIALFAKAYDLTINRHEEMEERAFQQQTLSSTTSASRGSIYDRTGTVLAMSATADTVQLDPMAIQNRADELDQERAEKMVNGLEEGETLPMTGQEYKDLIATTLSEILEVDIDSIYAQMERTFSQYEIVKKRVDRTVGDQIRAFISENKIQGIYLLSDSKRYYSYSNLACHVLGFLDDDNHGAYGIEALYNDELEGSSGLTVTARDARGQELMFQYEQYYDAENGDSLVLTIDSTIQYYVERGLEEMVAKYGAKNGATGIVMDVNSGALLAIASNPSYDLNDPRTIYDPLLQQQLAQAVPKDAAATDKPEEEWTEEASAAYNAAPGPLQLQQVEKEVGSQPLEPAADHFGSGLDLQPVAGDQRDHPLLGAPIQPQPGGGLLRQPGALPLVAVEVSHPLFIQGEAGGFAHVVEEGGQPQGGLRPHLAQRFHAVGVHIITVVGIFLVKAHRRG